MRGQERLNWESAGRVPSGPAGRTGWAVLCIAIGIAFSCQGTAAEGDEKAAVDPASGMIIAKDWELALAMCSGCHSPKLITSYGGTRQTWASLIDWMQKTQGLWPIEASMEDRILDYLAANYPPGEASRRRNLPISARPPNPYVSSVKAEYEARREKGEIVVP